MSLARQNSFFGSLSPLGGLAGTGLLIMASARLSWAITVAGSLFWVYGLSSFAYTSLFSILKDKFFPIKGRGALYTCLASFFAAVYLLLFWLLSPFAAFEVFIPVLLVPLFCANSDFVEQVQSSSENITSDIYDNVSDTVAQAASISVLLVLFSFIREPLSYCSLSFPGTYHGMISIELYKAGSLLPTGIFTISAGALLLLGYFICMFQYFRGRTGDYK
ncbi:MAG: hypothetical protein LBI28_14015 [Treponema sp.]|jgi:hypothetical protein|nr:hypothetical protein [Treponema sp.]